MKISLFADLHPLGERLSEWSAQFIACLDEANSLGCDRMLIAGDVFDASNLADGHASAGAVFRAVTEPLHGWLNDGHGRQFIAIPGNHDKASDAEVDALATLEPLGDDDQAIIARVPEWHIIEGPDETVAVLCLPWSWTPGNAEEVVRQMLADCPADATTKVLMAHAQVHGGRMGGGAVCESGSWILSRAFLDEMSREFDLVHLGDFHGEQEYAPNVFHNGALWQQNVGEAGNRQGFAIFDTETKRRTPVEVNVSRRFRKEFAHTAEEAAALAETFDREREILWIVTEGFELPRAAKVPLQERGILVKSKDVPKAARVGRVVEIGPASTLDDFTVLRAFVASRNGAIDGQEAAALELLLGEVIAANPKIASVTASTAGCMSPVRTSVRGVGKHIRETVIDWTRMGPLCAVFGDNGAGKTTAIGALPLAAYDAIPGYAGGMGDNLTCGGDSTGEAEGEFTSRGRRFRVTRTMTASTHKAWLREFVGASWEDIAGPKVTDVRAKVEALFGTVEAARSTWFVSADREDDLCAPTATPGKRREMFGQYLDFARMNLVAAACGDAAKEAETETRTLTEQLKGLPDYAAKLAETQAELTEAETVAVARTRERDEAKAALGSAETELRNASGDDSALRQAIKDHEAAVTALREADARENELNGEVATLRTRVDGLCAAKLDCAKLTEAREQIATLETQEKAWKAHDDWKREDTRLHGVSERADSAVRLAKAEAGVSDEDKALAAKYDGRRAEYKRLAGENIGRQSALDEHRRKSDTLARRKDVLSEQIARDKARLEKSPETPFGDSCRIEKGGCQFLRDFLELPGRIEAAEKELAEVAEKIAALVAPEPLHDLAAVESDGKLAGAAKARVDKASAASGKIEAAEVALREANAALSAHGELMPEAVEDPSSTLRTVRAKADSLAGAPARVESLERDATTLHAKEDALAEARTKQENAFDAERELRDPADRARTALADRETALANLRQRVDMAKGTLGTAENAVTSNAALQGTLRERIAGHERGIEETGRKREACNASERRAARLRTLQVAFGPKGVQPILIDAAAPELEDIANGLLADATDGEHSLRIVTQEATDKGEIRETFLVLVTDERGERDIGKFSGGEREKVQIVFRAALSLWLARRMGSPLESLIIDEAFNKLTPKNHRAMVKVLEGLSRHFDRIVIITPNPSLVALFPSQVWIHPTWDGCRVEYRGASSPERQASEAGPFDHVGADGTVTPDAFAELAVAQ